MTVAHDPIAAAEQWLAPVRLDETSVLFVIGFGEGHVLDVLDRRRWSGHVVALEPAAASAPESLTRKPVREWQLAGRLTMLAGPDYTGLDKILRGLPRTTEKPVIAGNPVLARAHREACVGAARIVTRGWFGARANQEAKRQNAGRYLLNTLRNVHALAGEGNAAALRGAFAGQAALIVAAGPSLDRNIPDIVALRGRVLLVAVDTALRPLLAAGVQPDFVVAIDPSEANARHLTDLPPCPETFLVAEGSLDPEAVRHFEGRTFFCRIAGHHPWPWLRSAGHDCHQMRAWGSVLTTAFDLALTMGCEPIAFAGADLAYPGGRPYARGTAYEEDWRRAEAWGDSLEQTWATSLAEWPETFEAGVDGSRVRTAPHLRSFRDWIVTEAGKASGRTIINATGGGILVGAGIEQSTLTASLGQEPVRTSSVQLLTDLHRRSQTAGVSTLPAVTDDTAAGWVTFAGVTRAAIANALQPVRPSAPAALAPVVRAAATAVPLPRWHPSLSDADAVYVAGLAEALAIRTRVLTDPNQDLLAELREDTRELKADQVVIVIDDVGVGAGAQVRRAIDALLCERADLWLEYRRFVDHASRVTVIRGDAAQLSRPATDADAAKWDAAHQSIANSLVPMIVKEFAPGSAVDLGCGAGYWLKALAANGVSTVRGVSSRPDGETVAPGIVRAPMTAVPELGQRFDVCLCLEIAQRLRPDEQNRVIDACVAFSDTVIFSSTLPGAPASGPFARPLQYWAAKFRDRGYVLDETLRARIQEHWDSPRTVFDCLVTFRRDHAAVVVPDFYQQAIWWSVLASARRPQGGQRAVPSRAALTPWLIPSSRLLAATASTRVFRFRSEAARWFVTHQGGALELHEDGQLLPDVRETALVPAAINGGWSVWRDEITVKASDDSDPRRNGRRYTLLLPSHVAWAESQPVADILRNGL